MDAADAGVAVWEGETAAEPAGAESVSLPHATATNAIADAAAITSVDFLIFQFM